MKAVKSFRIPEYIRHWLDKYKYVLLVCVVGLALALMSFDGDEHIQQDTTASRDLDSQIRVLEENLESVFSSISGVGRVKVLLTVKSGYESVYAYDENKTANKSESSAASTSQSQLVTITGETGKNPAVVRINSPVFMGAVVVCDGGDNAKVCLQLTQAIKSLTGITADSITISKMKD